MLKLEHVALELFEYKVEEVRARRTVRGGISSVWQLYDHLQRQTASLEPDERRRLELAGRALRSVSDTGTTRGAKVTQFSDLVLGGTGTEPSPGLESATFEDLSAPQSEPHRSSPEVAAEQSALQRLAAKVWRHDLDRFVRRLAGGLRAERDRYTARLLFAVHRNLEQYAKTEESRGDSELQRFRVFEAIPQHDDPFFSVNDVESLSELVQETIDRVLDLSSSSGPYRHLRVRPGSELAALRRVAHAVAADPYAGKAGMLEQRGPNAQQLRVAIQELGKERLRDEERVNQRRQLEERLQQVLAFERHQRQMFHQDVARFGELVEAFFDRLARYLPTSTGGQAGTPRLTGGVLFAVNPGLRVESVAPHVSAATVRLKGATRLRVSGLEVSVSGSGAGQKLYVRGEEHPLADQMAVACERKWLYAFKEGEYLHLKVEDEARSLAVRVAEAAAVLSVLASPERDALMAALQALTSSTTGDPQELVRVALESLAVLTAKAPDRRAALEGFIRGSARAAHRELGDEAAIGLADSLQRAMSVGTSDLAELLASVDLGETAVHTLTGDPLALEVATFSLTVRQYRSSGEGSAESLVVMLPGHALGTFEEYLIEPLGNGLLICVRGDQELVVAYKRRTDPAGTPLD
jgi:hypothetical protein